MGIAGRGLNLVCPRSLPIMVRLSPSASALLAKECLRSWMRTSSSSARLRMRPPRPLQVGEVRAGELAGDNPGIVVLAGNG